MTAKLAYLVAFALAAALVLSATPLHAWYLLDAQAGAMCGTDTECAAFCPPPSDHPDCDGGPQ